MAPATELNPYNATRPGNAFVGRETLLSTLTHGLTQGNSYAVVGGRSIGKSSLLQVLQRQASALPGLHVGQLDMQSLDAVTPVRLWAKLGEAITGQAEPWRVLPSDRAFETFLDQLQHHSAPLAQARGADWAACLLVDELDMAARVLPDDTFFQNLRHFLMASPFASRIRLVATGASGMTDLIAVGSSLNCLRRQDLGCLTPEESATLVRLGWPKGASWVDELSALTGGHPYLLQGALEELWGHTEPITTARLHTAAQSLLRRFPVFANWLAHLTPAARTLFRVYIRQDTWLSRDHALAHTPQAERSAFDDTQRLLAIHGVITLQGNGQARWNGSLFRDWFLG